MLLIGIINKCFSLNMVGWTKPALCRLRRLSRVLPFKSNLTLTRPTRTRPTFSSHGPINPLLSLSKVSTVQLALRLASNNHLNCSGQGLDHIEMELQFPRNRSTWIHQWDNIKQGDVIILDLCYIYIGKISLKNALLKLDKILGLAYPRTYSHWLGHYLMISWVAMYL